jgi:hypothetical protein
MTAHELHRQKHGEVAHLLAGLAGGLLIGVMGAGYALAADAEAMVERAKVAAVHHVDAECTWVVPDLDHGPDLPNWKELRPLNDGTGRYCIVTESY